jgi:hypothetical protein
MIYKITWEQEMYKSSDPLSAVQSCFEEIKNGESLAFTVEDSEGKKYSIDLNEQEGDEVIEINND